MIYPVRSRVVSLGNTDAAQQMAQREVDRMEIGPGGMTVGTVKQLKQAQEARAAQTRREAADLTNVANSLGVNDPAFKRARAELNAAKKAHEAAEKVWRNKALLPNKCTRWEIRYRRGDRRSLDPAKYCSGPRTPNDCICRSRGSEMHPEKAKAKAALEAAERRLQNAKSVMRTAAKAAMNRLSANYPYKGYIIKPKLTPDYAWIRFDIQSDKTGQTLTTAERIREAQAWVDREVARQQERDIKVYDEARSEAVDVQLEATKELVAEQNRAIASMLAQRKQKQGEDAEAAKKRRNLILAAAAAGGALLLLGGGS